jgi:hypothetical protein
MRGHRLSARTRVIERIASAMKEESPVPARRIAARLPI